MMNYMKSECYRTLNTRTFYLVTLVLGGLVLLMNLIYFVSGRSIPDFRYDTFRFH